MFRRLQPYDLLTLRPFAVRGLANEAQPLESLTQPAGWPGTMASLAGTWVPWGRRRQSWVLAPQGRLVGLVTIRPRSGPSAWEIERLTSVQPSDLGGELLEHVVLAAGEAGVERLFLRLPQDSAWGDVVQRAGFSVYTQEQLYLGSLSSWVMPPALPLRPRQGEDDMALFRLYCLLTPPAVRQAVGITFQEWCEGREPFKGGQEMVLEEGAVLVGWLRLMAWARARQLEVLAHPYRGDLEALAHYALASCPPRSTISCLVPDYQAGLGRLLEEFNFRVVARYVSLVGLVAVRSRHPCLLPVQA